MDIRWQNVITILLANMNAGIAITLWLRIKATTQTILLVAIWAGCTFVHTALIRRFLTLIYKYPTSLQVTKYGMCLKTLGALYQESRTCVAASAYTSSILTCRKLLMNIAVSQGADEGKRFIDYVDYLSENGFVPPNGKAWVDHIRKKGNEATHEIRLMQRADAIELINFTEMLLKFIYEFPAIVPGSEPEIPQS